MFIKSLSQFSYSFPNPKFANDEGLLAYGGDLSLTRLLSAYEKGIFPWYNEGDPILWWSPNPRMILELENFKASKSLRKKIDKNVFDIKFDSNFKQVIENCSQISRNYTDHTWIRPEVIDAYCELFTVGYAHSFEAYVENELVGGGYGVTIGDVFCGESMFCKKSDASKVALFWLVQKLKEKNFRLIDCQIPSPHLQSLGAHTIDRDEFLGIMRVSLSNPREF